MTQKKKKNLNKLYRKLSVKDKKELQKLIIFGKKIEEEERVSDVTRDENRT